MGGAAGPRDGRFGGGGGMGGLSRSVTPRSPSRPPPTLRRGSGPAAPALDNLFRHDRVAFGPRWTAAPARRQHYSFRASHPSAGRVTLDGPIPASDPGSLSSQFGMVTQRASCSTPPSGPTCATPGRMRPTRSSSSLHGGEHPRPDRLAARRAPIPSAASAASASCARSSASASPGRSSGPAHPDLADATSSLDSTSES